MTEMVHAVRHGDRDAGTGVVLRVGSVYVILIVVVKIGYLEPELFDMSVGWKMALTPGGVDQDLLRLGHRRIRRPVFPFDPEMPDPDLTARIIPPSNTPLDGADE